MKLNLAAPINTLGYGYASVNFLVNLEAQGVEVSYWPIGPIEADTRHHQTIRNCIERQLKGDFDPNADSLRIFHANDLGSHIGRGQHIGFPFFELDRFTKQELAHLNSLDRVFVPSHWAKTIVETETTTPATVVPLGVDTETFHPANINESGKTVFLNVGKWEVRKGHDVLCEAFNRAFSPSDRVELRMMNHNVFLTPERNGGKDGNAEWESYYKSSKLGEKITIVPRQPSHTDVANVMYSADCGVFPARAEGWNLELLEMMACGRHVIATSYSAHSEFCNQDNARLIPNDGMEKAFDGKWFFGQGEWMEFGESQIDCLVEHMREVHKLKQAGELKTNVSGIKTAEIFSWQRSTARLIEALNDTYHKDR